jgi:hypothetical protein
VALVIIVVIVVGSMIFLVYWASEERACTVMVTSMRTTGSSCDSGIELVELLFEPNSCFS